MAPGDIPYVRHIRWTLNDAVRRAAVATGTAHIDLSTVSDGHDACKPIGTRWVEPILQETNAVVVHPNALGEASIAERLMRCYSSANSRWAEPRRCHTRSDVSSAQKLLTRVLVTSSYRHPRITCITMKNGHRHIGRSGRASRLLSNRPGGGRRERPGTQADDKSGALPSRFIGHSLAGLGDGIGIERVT